MKYSLKFVNINLTILGLPVAYDSHEIHVATCVLKAFFRELPESLIPETIFSEIMSLQGKFKIKKKKLQKFKFIVVK